jgi:hypothetical protein
MGVKRWRTSALHRTAWASVVRETKAELKGPSCLGPLAFQLRIQSETINHLHPTARESTEE